MTASKIISMKNKEKIAMITAYDFLSAKILCETGIDIILVGDSLGQVFQGLNSTIPVKIEEIVYHCKAVRQGAPDAFIIADMPFLSYGITIEDSVKNAGLCLKEGFANAVKIEGGVYMIETIMAMTSVGIPVMGHIGLRPQSINRLGRRIVGKTLEEAKFLIEEAKAIEKAGGFSLVIEGTTEEAAKAITESVSIPTIGIGAGRYTDGQVLVLTDMLGMDKEEKFKHNKHYANLYRIIKKAVSNYIKEVKQGVFPGPEHSFHQE